MEMFFVAQANYAYDVWHTDNAFLMLPTVRQNSKLNGKFIVDRKRLSICGIYIYSV